VKILTVFLNVVNVSPIKMQFMSLLIVSSHTKTSKFFSAIAEKESVAYILVEKREQVMFALREQRINLVLFDWEISEDAEKLLVEVRKEFSPKKLPVIVVHNFESEEFVLKTLDLGATDFIYKPFQGALEQIKIRNLLLLQQTNEILESKEEEIAGFREFNSSIINSSKDCFKILDLQGNLLSMNKAGQEMLEIVNIEPFIGKSWLEYWKGEYYTKAKEAVAKAKGGSVGSFEGFCPTQTGKPKWWSIIISPILNKDGDLDRLLSVSRDITIRKKADFELKKRVKELNCIEKFSNIIQKGDSVKAILGKLVHILHESFQFPESTGFKITYNGYVFETSNFKLCVPAHTTNIISEKLTVGMIEVGLCEQSELSILPEEITLLNVIAERMGKIIDRHEQNKNYKCLFDTLNEAIIRANSEGMITEANQAAAVVCGYPTPEELIGEHMKVLYAHPEKRSEVLTKMELEGDALYNYEFLLRQKNGDTIWTLCNIRILRNSSGDFIGTLGAFRDISNVKKAEDELLKAKNKLVRQLNFTESLIDNIPNPIFYKDRDGKYLGCNEAFEKFTGKKSSEIIYKTVFQLWNTERAEIYHSKDLELMEKGGSQRYEFQVTNAQGELRDVIFLKKCFLNDQNQVAGIIGTYIDITDRIKAEQTIKESEEKYRRLYDSMNEGVCLHELVFNKKGEPVDYKILDVNPKYEEILGLNKQEVEGNLASEIYPGNAPPFLNKYLEVAVSGKSINFETYFEGYQKYFKISAFSPAKDQFATVFHDITERKISQLQLIERKKEVEILLHGTRLVLESKDFLTTAKAIFDYCRELTGAKAGYIGLLKESGHENELLYLEAGGMSCTVDPELPMPIRGLRKVVYETGNTIYDNEYQNSLHVKYMPEGHIPLKNVMFAPLKINGKTVGLLGLGEKEGDFNDNDAKIASSLAELISIALVNSRFLDKIKNNEERYKRLVNNTTSLILEVNADTHEIVSCNPAMANSLNKTVDVLLGRKISDFLPASLFVKRKEMGERALKEMKVLRFEDERNGRYFLNNLIPYVNEKGRFVQSITHDITNTKIKQDLIDNEEALSSIIENIPFAVLVGTLTGDLVRVNNTTVKYTGYTLDELLKMNITDIDTYSKNRDNLVLIHEQLYGGDGIVFQTIHTRKDGTTYPAEVNVTAIKLKQEPLLIAIIQDITDRKKAEEDLRISEAKYRELNATKDKFFSIISHDLRSPFNAILGLSDLAVKKLQNKEYERIQTYTEAIQQTSRQAYSLLNNLLYWSRLQRGKIDFKPEKIKLSEEVHKAVGLMRANLSEKSIYLSVNVPGNLTIYADPDMLETIIRNLLSNAVKFTNKNGKISILAKQKDGAVLVEIEDSGVGIDSENMNKLFSISSNYSTPGTNKEEGSGLGLVLCKEFVDKHNGKIWVESEEGKGTKFSFIL
jgi:PAS domain S-box-containing protein